jgi:putative inorganic carbon (hco3(-)) transporter
MGFVFTVVYIVLTIISPEQFGQEWASYHILLYLAGITALTSLTGVLTRSHLRSSTQTYLLIGFILSIGFSQVANHWFGGAIQSWLEFLPSAAVYFFIVANVTSLRRLKLVTLAVVVSCLVLVVEALYGYYGGFLGDTFVLKMNYSHDQVVEQFLRLRGAGFLNDPNDFAQMLLIAVPLIFVAWRQGRVLANSFFVLAPAAVLLWAVYLTHSRGALIGLGVLGLVAAKKRLGTTASVAMASVLAVGLMALDFTGGRGISASEGADRLEAWATGLELFKHSPIFGVGFGNFTNFSVITAHNSIVLCLAELGLVGATMWLALLVSTTTDLNRLITVREQLAITGGHNQAETISTSAVDVDRSSFPEQTDDDNSNELPAEDDLADVARMEEHSSIGNVADEWNDGVAEVQPFPAKWISKEETASSGDVREAEVESVYEPIVPRSWLEINRLALISFMTTGWFLSRTYDTPIYLVLGLATAAIALDRPDAETGNRAHWIPVTLAVEALAIIVVYFVVRLRH